MDLGQLGRDDLGRLADGRHGFVRLSGGAVDRLDPQSTLRLVMWTVGLVRMVDGFRRVGRVHGPTQSTLGLVVRREHDLVALANGVEEVLAALQTCSATASGGFKLEGLVGH